MRVLTFTFFFFDRKNPHFPLVSEVQFVHSQFLITFPNQLIIGVLGNDDVFPDYCVNSTWLANLLPVWQRSIFCGDYQTCFKHGRQIHLPPNPCKTAFAPADPNNNATWYAGGYYTIWPYKGLKVTTFRLFDVGPSLCRLLLSTPST